jgi:hypothetical protein
MPPPNVVQPSEPLGTCYTLGELERVIARAINRYGSDTKIFGENEKRGIVVDAHFPRGERPHVSFTQIEVAYSDTPPENLV